VPALGHCGSRPFRRRAQIPGRFFLKKLSTRVGGAGYPASSCEEIYAGGSNQKERALLLRQNILSVIWLLASSLVLSGCSWTDSGGTHHLIVGLGFGIITTTNRSGVEVRDSRVLGGEIGPDGVGLGWMQHHRVAIDPAVASNVVISIKASRMGITVKNFDPYSSNTNTVKQGTPAKQHKETNQ
jgi:hypothetical protein